MSRTRLGTVNPVRALAARAHGRGALVLVDGAQSAAHLRIDVADLGCDFFAFSGHKVYGPTGVGVLYGRAEVLAAMPPWQGGGDMIEQVALEGSTWAAPPARFEAGTPPIAAVLGLATALDYFEAVGLDRIAAWEEELLRLATERVGEIRGVRLVGTAPEKVAVLSFILDGVHPHDVGTILDDEGVAVRAGHHCAQPVMDQPRDPGDRAGLVCLLQHGARRSKLSPAASRAVPRCSADVQHARALPERHPGAQPLAAELPGHGRRRSPGRGQQPALRRPLTVWLKLDGDVIRMPRFQGTGCAISKASASLMTAAVKGKSRERPRRLFERFHRLVTGRPRLRRRRKPWASSRCSPEYRRSRPG